MSYGYEGLRKAVITGNASVFAIHAQQEKAG
jgi:hypothetical protein